MSELLERARQCCAQGQINEAARLYHGLLSQTREPALILEALENLALFAFSRGKPVEALPYLEQASRLDYVSARLLTHLGVAYRASERFEEAAQALGRALQLEAENPIAHLYSGAVQRAMGNGLQAVRHYYLGLVFAQRQGQWRSAETTPAPLRALVAEALDTVRDFRPQACAQLEQALVMQCGAEETARVRRGLRFALGTEPAVYESHWQLPKLFYVPGLPMAGFFDAETLDWMPAFLTHAEAIGEDLAHLLRNGAQFAPFLKLSNTARVDDYVKSSVGAAGWTSYFFYRHGRAFEDHLNACPNVGRALDNVPLSRVPGGSPEVLFSALAAGAKIVAHRGDTNTRCVVHLPLIVPGQCAIRVGDETREWQMGRCLMFDDTYEHEAWNNSGHTRIVMLMDVWNPWLTEVERAAIAAVVPQLHAIATAFAL